MKVAENPYWSDVTQLVRPKQPGSKLMPYDIFYQICGELGLSTHLFSSVRSLPSNDEIGRLAIPQFIARAPIRDISGFSRLNHTFVAALALAEA